MQVSVRYFAGVRERLGASSETLELAEGSTVEAVWESLCLRHPALVGLRRYIRLALNLEFVDADQLVAEGDEIALIPPVAGGSSADDLLLSVSPLDEAAITARVERPEAGAVVVFRGVVRNHSKGQAVEHLEYEVYPEMAMLKLRQVIDEVEQEFPDVKCALTHRTGVLQIGEAAVVIAVSSPHRAVAFEACARAIDRIKEVVPIWKKEVGPDGTSWVGMGS